jgi:hypothetical protein
MTPRLRARFPTRCVLETASGRPLAKNVSVCGPLLMSTHSVSLGGATVPAPPPRGRRDGQAVAGARSWR